MKLPGNTKRTIIKDKYGKNIPHLEITEVVSAYYYIVNNDYQQDSRVLYTFIPSKSFGQLSHIFHLKNIFFKKLLIQNFHI